MGPSPPNFLGGMESRTMDEDLAEELPLGCGVPKWGTASTSFLLLPGEIGQGGEGEADAAAEEPAVPGTLRLPDPLQRLPAPGEEGLLAAALQPLDARGEAFPAHAAEQDLALPPVCRALGRRPPVLFDTGFLNGCRGRRSRFLRSGRAPVSPGWWLSGKALQVAGGGWHPTAWMGSSPPPRPP